MLSTNPALFEGFQVHTITAELFSAQSVCTNITLQGFITLSCSLGISVSKWSHRVGEIALACFLPCTSWLRCSHFRNDMVIRVSWSKTFFFAFRSPSWNSSGSDGGCPGLYGWRPIFYSSFTALASRTSTDYSWNNGDTTLLGRFVKAFTCKAKKCFLSHWARDTSSSKIKTKFSSTDKHKSYIKFIRKFELNPDSSRKRLIQT